jgi:hypothetical protein
VGSTAKNVEQSTFGLKKLGNQDKNMRKENPKSPQFFACVGGYLIPKADYDIMKIKNIDF